MTTDRRIKDKISDIMIMIGIPLLVAMMGWVMNSIDNIRDDGQQNSMDIIEVKYMYKDLKAENVRDSANYSQLNIRLEDVESIIHGKMEATLPENKHDITPPR